MIVHVLKKIIKAYYWTVSPWLGNRCRYVPSCSEYAMQALDQHGAIKGLWLSMKRISRCHPWGGDGHDPVPTSCGQQRDNLSDANLDKNK